MSKRAEKRAAAAAAYAGVDRERYRVELAKRGVEYYVAGRHGALHLGLMEVSGANLHHAVEMFLKAALVKHGTPLEDLKYEYTHHLRKAWAKVRPLSSSLAQHDETLAKLDAFEALRYPDEVLKTGATMIVGRGVALPSLPTIEGVVYPHFEIDIDALDAMLIDIVDVAGLNPGFIRPRTEEARQALATDNMQAARWKR